MGREEAIAAAIAARSERGCESPHPATRTAAIRRMRALACTDVTVRRTACLVAVALAAFAAPAPVAAWGDADPASDYLPGFDTYYPFGNAVAKPTQGQLDRLVKIARTRGRPFKVAVIATPVDLGAVTSLFNKPQPYSKFLYREIAGLLQGA